MQAGDDAVARGRGLLREAIGAPRLGRLGKRHQQRALGGGEPLRLLAEIGERRGAGALDVAAIGGEHEVEVEDLLLGEAALELHGAHHLGQLVGKAAGRARLEQARHLHGQRRAAGDDAGMGCRLPCGPQQGAGVDAMMIVEALVLIGDEHGEEARVHVLCGDGQAPVAVLRDEGAEQPAVAVGHQRRIGDAGTKRHGPQPPQRLAQREARGIHRKHAEEQPRIEAQGPSAAGPRHQGAVTVTLPVALRALSSGRYMSSTVAPGCT